MHGLRDSVADLCTTTLAALVWLGCCAILAPPAPAMVTADETPSAGELSITLDKLSVLGSVLYVAAHPDDENTALLSYLSRGALARTGYLSLTRGDGGQNLIGTERGELLGLVRTQELLAARRRDGAEQFFTRAVDFGYTKSVDETLEKWGKEAVLSDVVRVMRRFRPDVIVMRFPGDGRGGHGQHTASAVLAAEAFDAAADPERFPEQLNGPEPLEPWQAKRLLWDAARFFGPGEMSSEGIVVDVGAYSPRLGESFTEIAAQSRSMHKSQGFGATARRGSRVNRLEHRKGIAARESLFDDIDTSWSRVGGAAVGQLIERAAQSFDGARPSRVVPLLLDALQRLEDLEQVGHPWVQRKREEIEATLLAACGLRIDLLAAKPTAIDGETLDLTLEAINRSPLRVSLLSIERPFVAAAMVLDRDLVENEQFEHKLELPIDEERSPTQPYWLRSPAASALFQVADEQLIGRAESPPLTVLATVQVEDVRLKVTLPVRYRWTDRVDGERVRNVTVMPEIAVELGTEVLVFPDTQAKTIKVTVRGGERGATAQIALRLPNGWGSEPAQALVALPGDGGSLQQGFAVTPPMEASGGEVVAEVTTTAGGSSYRRSVQTIDYRHIPVQTLWRDAKARVVRLDLERRGARIGYVEGSGDEIPEALRQIGYEVTLLSDEDLAADQLSAFDALVLGVRAYNARPAVLANLANLLRYVADGGTLVSQYNTVSRRSSGTTEYGPFPFAVSRDRVSVEEAPVTVLQPDHPVLTTPNRITAQDFDGWVQERGLYFPNEWDQRYAALLASNDPGEPPRQGGLLVAEYGKGIYIYTGYSFFRELPAGVPGAYRLFANLLSARQPSP